MRLLTARIALVDQGKTDEEIAAIEGTTRGKIARWRRQRSIGPNAAQAELLVPAVVVDERMANYQLGLNDIEIGKRHGCSTTSIQRWRALHNLPPNLPPGRNTGSDPSHRPITRDLKDRCIRLLRKGVGARVIARECNIAQQTLEKWRTMILKAQPELRRQGTAPRAAPRFPSGKRCSRLAPARRFQAFMLYACDLPDAAIARELGIYPQQVGEWRRAFFLPANAFKRLRRRSRGLGAPITPLSNPIHAAIVDAIGRYISPDMAADAAGEMWLALAEGELSVDRIEAEAGKYRSKALRTYADTRNRSLDAPIGEGDDFNLLSMMRDEGASDWLERMGATVC